MDTGTKQELEQYRNEIKILTQKKLLQKIQILIRMKRLIRSGKRTLQCVLSAPN